MRLLLICSLLLFQCQFLNAQGINNNWLTGYSSSGGLPFGVSTINFFTGSATSTYTPMDMEFSQTHANISDANGNLLFYTNGYYIADASGDTMLNGSGINPSNFTSLFPDGLTLVQSHIILPIPNELNKYYLFHTTRDDLSLSVSKFLYVSIIDMSLNSGKGAVTLKNQILISDDLNKAKLSAVKHGNGRDWWLLCHKLNTNTFYKLLITPSGISLPATQSIGIVRPEDTGQVWFSPDGSKFAYYWQQHGLEIFDFDRCSGLFTRPMLIYLMRMAIYSFIPTVTTLQMQAVIPC